MVGTSAGGKDLLRVLTCGGVDDGKSTLIGRLLYESQLLPKGQLDQLRHESRNRMTGPEGLDFSLLVDGLMAEREQGITIDVAYRFFETVRRRYIIADAPGHEQYTRNMVTGASRADLALLFVDARKGPVLQTRRHAFVAALMGIPGLILAVNKMDLVRFDMSTFTSISDELTAFALKLGFVRVKAIPVSGLLGDNVLQRSRHMPWFTGGTILEGFEEAKACNEPRGAFRMPVQYVVKRGADFRGFAGLVVGGSIGVGDEVLACPTRVQSRVKRIVTFDGDLENAEIGQSIVICLSDDIDVGRGHVLTASSSPVVIADQFVSRLIWMDEEPLYPGRSYAVRLGTNTVNGSATDISSITDVVTLVERPAKEMRRNEIGYVKIATDRLVGFDAYRENRDMGGFILIDRLSNRTAAAGVIMHALRRGQNLQVQKFDVDRTLRAQVKGHRSAIVWLTGLSGAGKSTIANIVERRLTEEGRHCYVLDGDNLRQGINRDLGFTPADRVENVRRVAEIAKLLADAGLIVIVSLISPFLHERALARELAGEIDFLEVFIDAPLAVCEARDPKGLYMKARAGVLPNFTGIDAPYQAPAAPELILQTTMTAPEVLANALIDQLRRRSIA
jgi:bifunctional enzyme CysN/CysC